MTLIYHTCLNLRKNHSQLRKDCIKLFLWIASQFSSVILRRVSSNSALEIFELDNQEGKFRPGHRIIQGNVIFYKSAEYACDVNRFAYFKTLRGQAFVPSVNQKIIYNRLAKKESLFRHKMIDIIEKNLESGGQWVIPENIHTPYGRHRIGYPKI